MNAKPFVSYRGFLKPSVIGALHLFDTYVTLIVLHWSVALHPMQEYHHIPGVGSNG